MTFSRLATRMTLVMTERIARLLADQTPETPCLVVDLDLSVAAYQAGVRLFAFDSAHELEKLARAAPGARVFCRILVTCDGAEWPLSRKFGCAPEMAMELLRQARDAGLDPYGISFHVGSQQTNL